MPYVKGFLEIVSPGEPAHPIAPGGPPPEIWPEPGYPSHPIVLPEPPPGIWPPGTISHPIVPVPPSVNLPPGEIWPPVEGAPAGKFVVLVYVPGMGYKYVIVDPSLKPTPVKT